jgi:hypothetical protein
MQEMNLGTRKHDPDVRDQTGCNDQITDRRRLD